MGDKSKIEWTEASWNPVAGCSRVSSGCDNCYAMHMAKRIQSMGNTTAYDGTTRQGKSGTDWTGKINLLPDRLDQPLRWTRPRRIFVNSMSDLFHPSVPFEFVDTVFAVMALAQQHTFQILTKRLERMAEYFATGRYSRCVNVMTALDGMMEDYTEAECKRYGYGEALELLATDGWPLPNVWLGTSVENQETADERIPHLLRCDAAVRWLSMEPLLGPVDLDPYPYSWDGRTWVDWVVAGGESGHGARPMNPQWVESLRDQCVGADVPFFFKQWGAWIPLSSAHGGPNTWSKAASSPLANGPHRS